VPNAPKNSVSLKYIQCHACTYFNTASPLSDPLIWAIFKHYLTSDASYGDILARVKLHLGDAFIESDWSGAMTVLFLGDDDDTLSLPNFRAVRVKHLTDDRAINVSLQIILYIK
jgi:hypothetical protein